METVGKYHAFLGHDKTTSRNNVVKLINKFQSTSLNKKISVLPRSACWNEYISGVSESVEENSSTSIRHYTQRLSISRKFLQEI